MTYFWQEYELIIFDLDGTLAEYKTTNLLPGIYEWFDTWEKGDCKLGMATNQGGVGLRHWMEAGSFGDPTDYPEASDTTQRWHEIRDQLPEKAALELSLNYAVCFAYQSRKGLWAPVPHYIDANDRRWDPLRRKPFPGMIVDLMVKYSLLPKEVLFVGDSNEDGQAAKAAGCGFKLADEIFGRDQDDSPGPF